MKLMMMPVRNDEMERSPRSHWPDEMERSPRSHWPDEMERSPRSHWPEESEMRRGVRSHWPEESEMRRGVSRSAMDDESDMKMRQIGFIPEMSMGKVVGAAVEQLDPRLYAVLEDASDVLKDAPPTWEPYIKAGDYMGILRMEGKELLKALDQGKSMKDARKELTHTLAAVFQIFAK